MCRMSEFEEFVETARKEGCDLSELPADLLVRCFEWMKRGREMQKCGSIPKVWYCKYCHKRRQIDIGPDGSIVVCTACRYGLAPMPDVIAAGTMQAWYDGICERFEEENR